MQGKPRVEEIKDDGALVYLQYDEIPGREYARRSENISHVDELVLFRFVLGD